MRLLMGFALVGAASAMSAQQPPAPRLERIEMRSTTWGHLAVSWSIDAEGNVRWTVPEPNPFNAERIVTRGFAVGTTGFRRLRVLIGLAERRAGTRMACNNPITDAASGTVRWVQRGGRSAALSFYTGCRERATRAVLDQLEKADALVAEWAEAGVVVETTPTGKQ